MRLVKVENRRVFTDLEYLYPGMTKESGRPDSTDLRQIVQIAAIKFDSNNQEIDRLDILVTPTYTHTLPDFFSKLTGIVQDDMQEAVSLASGLDAFTRFVFDCEDNIFTFDKDFEVFQQNAGYLNRDLGLSPFTRVKALLPTWGVDPEAYSSGTLHKAAGIDMSGWVHNALFDVISMSAAVFHFENNCG